MRFDWFGFDVLVLKFGLGNLLAILVHGDWIWVCVKGCWCFSVSFVCYAELPG